MTTMTNALDPARVQQRREACVSLLRGLIAQSPAVVFASLSAVDGRLVAAASGPTRSDVDPQRVSALTSSLLALSESFAREVRGGRCSHATVSMEVGSVVTVRVPTSRQLHVLSVCADQSANLAMALRWTLDTAKKIAHELGAA